MRFDWKFQGILCLITIYCQTDLIHQQLVFNSNEWFSFDWQLITESGSVSLHVQTIDISNSIVISIEGAIKFDRYGTNVAEMPSALVNCVFVCMWVCHIDLSSLELKADKTMTSSYFIVAEMLLMRFQRSKPTFFVKHFEQWALKSLDMEFPFQWIVRIYRLWFVTVWDHFMDFNFKWLRWGHWNIETLNIDAWTFHFTSSKASAQFEWQILHLGSLNQIDFIMIDWRKWIHLKRTFNLIWFVS